MRWSLLASLVLAFAVQRAQWVSCGPSPVQHWPVGRPEADYWAVMMMPVEQTLFVDEQACFGNSLGDVVICRLRCTRRRRMEGSAHSPTTKMATKLRNILYDAYAAPRDINENNLTAFPQENPIVWY